VKLCIKPERRAEFLACIANNQRGTLSAEPLALTYEYGEDAEAPNTFHFFEQYAGRAGFEARVPGQNPQRHCTTLAIDVEPLHDAALDIDNAWRRSRTRAGAHQGATLRRVGGVRQLRSVHRTAGRLILLAEPIQALRKDAPSRAAWEFDARSLDSGGGGGTRSTSTSCRAAHACYMYVVNMR
jgi:quinol monooxygenase YgiN